MLEAVADVVVVVELLELLEVEIFVVVVTVVVAAAVVTDAVDVGAGAELLILDDAVTNTAAAVGATTEVDGFEAEMELEATD